MKTKIDFAKLPSKSTTHKFVDELYDYIFPVEINFTHNEDFNEEKLLRIKLILNEALLPLENSLSKTRDTLVSDFLNQIPDIREKLIVDANLFLQSDPAAECIEEIIIAYPGFYAIAVYRIAHYLYDMKIPILPRIITEYAHTKTGIDIHPGAEIGTPFFIDHGTGVVIGQTTIIGNFVKLYQGVTLGALAVRKESEGTKRHPTIEDNVIIYAGSCILGGSTVIGNDSVIGGNVWLTESVPAFSIVYHKSDVKIRDKSEMREVIDYVI